MEPRQADRIRAIIAEQLRIDAARVTPGALLAADLGADDLDTLEIIMELETVLEIAITPGAEDGIATVGDLIGVVAAILAGGDEA